MPPQPLVTPHRWTARGEAWVQGRGRSKPMVLWGGIPGETARVRILGEGQHQAYAEVLETKKPHADRVEPPCDRYRLCGGCPWMHLNPGAQERAHRELVADAFAQEGLEVPIDAWHPSPDGLADFRHVVKLGIEKNDIGRTKIGAWGRNNRRVVPISKCVVAHPVLNQTMTSLAHHVLELDVWPWEAEEDRGVLRAAVLRASRSTGKVLITLIAARQSKRLRDLAEAVAGSVSAVTGVWLHLNNDPGNAIFGRDEMGAIRTLPMLGSDSITETLNGVEYRIGPGDFFQTNPAMAEVLYTRTLDRLQPGPDDTFVDLYSGVGGIALQAAKRGTGFVLGIEEIDGAVARARSAARANRLQAEFMAGRVDQVGPDLTRRLVGTAPLISVNPARRGLEEGVVEQIAELEPRRVAYISCNPTALARDLRRFEAVGLRLSGGIELFDMFPNTPHVESLVVLEGTAPEGPRRRAPRRRVVRRG